MSQVPFPEDVSIRHSKVLPESPVKATLHVLELVKVLGAEVIVGAAGSASAVGAAASAINAAAANATPNLLGLLIKNCCMNPEQ